MVLSPSNIESRVRNVQSFQKDAFLKVKSILALLDARTKKKFRQLLLVMVSINLLDILGIVFFATFASGVFDLIQKTGRPTRIEIILDEWLGFNPDRVSFLVTIATAMLVSFVLKSAISAFLNRRTLFFLASQESEFASTVLRNYLKRDAENFYQKSLEEVNYASGISVARIFNGVLFPLTQIINDIALLLFVLVALLYTSPTSTIFGVTLIGSWVVIIGRKVHTSTANASKSQVENSVITQESVRELYEGYREIVTKEYADFNREKFRNARHQQAYQQARLLWLQQIPRYSLEILVILSAAILSAFEFLVSDTRTALVKLSVFIVTVFRILPSIQRIQASSLAINSGLVASQSATSILNQTLDWNFLRSTKLSDDRPSPSKLKRIDFIDVSYKYKESKRYVIDSLSGCLLARNLVGISGESGVGKSTLVDCIVGLRKPSSGKITFRDHEGGEYFPKVAYVPQKPFLVNANLLINITLRKSVTEKKAIEVQRLFDFFFRKSAVEKSDVSLSLDSPLKSGVNSVSGGQAQRIAIMRALISDAEIVIFDECFTGLSETMTREIFAFLKSEYHHKTFLIISHSRLILNLCDVAYKLTNSEMKELIL